ncbi:MAG: caspase family protein [Vicinamibacterales bacterium]|nr:caspase family protein [Vicinamibacterales bacterium]
MAKGISLHIGLNHVDPDHYEGWAGALSACEADARDMKAIAVAQGFTVDGMLLSQQATAAAVMAAVKAAAKVLKAGDIFLITYSGHGGQVRDTNGDEPDRMDETWVLFDRQVVDDELYALWGRFKKGVRIVALSDSCHSGTVVRAVPDFVEGGDRVRAMPRSVGKKVEAAHARLYRAIQRENPPTRTVSVKAAILLISGCMDNQYSMDGPRNGAFTGTLKRVWKSGAFVGDYRRFRDRIVALMPATQTPNYFVIGAKNAVFEAQQPFTI